MLVSQFSLRDRLRTPFSSHSGDEKGAVIISTGADNAPALKASSRTIPFDAVLVSLRGRIVLSESARSNIDAELDRRAAGGVMSCGVRSANEIDTWGDDR